MDDECPHGLGEPAWCQLCNGKAERQRRRELAEKAARKRPPAWLLAKWAREREAGDRWEANHPARIVGAAGVDRRAFDRNGLLFEDDNDRMPRRLPR